MISNWHKVTRRDKSVCRLGALFSEVMVAGSCKFFDCPVFRKNMCRRQVLLADAANSNDTDTSHMWIDNDEFVVKIIHYGETADEDMLNMFDEFKYMWDALDGERCDCSFEQELMRLREDVLRDLKKAM